MRPVECPAPYRSPQRIDSMHQTAHSKKIKQATKHFCKQCTGPIMVPILRPAWPFLKVFCLEIFIVLDKKYNLVCLVLTLFSLLWSRRLTRFSNWKVNCRQTENRELVFVTSFDKLYVYLISVPDSSTTDGYATQSLQYFIRCHLGRRKYKWQQVNVNIDNFSAIVSFASKNILQVTLFLRILFKTFRSVWGFQNRNFLQHM